MSQISSMFGNLPGIGTINETYEQAITWGPASSLVWWNGWIDADAVDSGNNPTWRLRPGLVLGQITSTGRWTNYSPTATNGSEVAGGILAYGLRMQDVLSGLNTQKFYAIVVGGRVKGANLLGLDSMARQQMGASGRFFFDDNLPGNQWFPFNRFQAKTAAYQILSTDNFTEFNNTGASGSVTFTLPAIANGYMFGFRVIADQTLVVASSEGNNIVGLNNAIVSNASFATGSQKIGGGLIVYSNPGATKWHVWNTSAGTNTITLA